MIYYWDIKLKIKIECPGSWFKNNQRKHRFDVSSSKDHFLQDVYQINSIELVSGISHYHINGLHLFWDTLYISTLSRFPTSKIQRSNKRKWFQIKKARSTRSPTETMTDADYLTLLANILAQTKSIPHSLEQAGGNSGFYVNINKTA